MAGLLNLIAKHRPLTGKSFLCCILAPITYQHIPTATLNNKMDKLSVQPIMADHPLNFLEKISVTSPKLWLCLQQVGGQSTTRSRNI
jgi:hypothetical protein